MPVCLSTVQLPSTTGQDGVVVPGQSLLALDPGQTNLSTCSYVVISGQEAGNGLLAMSAEDGALVSAGIVSCWAAAFAIKSIIRVIKGSENVSS